MVRPGVFALCLLLGLLLGLLLTPAPALALQAPTSIPAFNTAIADARMSSLEGPVPGEHRTIYIWRPSNAPAGPLPVVYMADGLYGMYVAMGGLRDAVAQGRIAPFIVVGMDAGARDRRYWEYVRNSSHLSLFQAHEDWFLHVVIPFAERVAGASSDPTQRAVGGFSNGGAFALEMAERHPEMFAAVLAHSPVGLASVHLDERAAHMRWVLSAGHNEGEVGDVAAATEALIHEIRRNLSPVRRCVGPWGHQGRAWRDISPGSVAWLLHLGDPASVETTIERDACRLIDR